ncbi:LytTR family DNA-binding domain-containing protein [Maricaulis sp.]|uniref:LytTR family DNA-binding domain-containing protein n=1 Tax=Maricaulis sp. TaxID=1486257 RepID=UPI002602D8A7|nr:LytTR family DNA-binding domain-containing protein [Maricaulis sp.]
MAYERLKHFASLAEPLAVQLLVAVLVLAVSWPAGEPVSHPDVRVLDGNAAQTALGPDSPEGALLPSYRVDPGDSAIWVRWDGVVLPDDASTPLALMLSGPFSATIYWNGDEIGRKGQPGTERAEEVAGEIDGLYAIPAALVRSDTNYVSLRLSSHRAGYTPSTYIQIMAVVPYRADARRSLRYYAPTILISGALTALFILILRLALGRQYPPALWLAAGLAALMIALLAEISRALINYPYDWHQPRQAIQMVGACGFCASLLLYTASRWNIGKYTGWFISLLTTAVSLLAVVFLRGYDAKSVIACMCLIAASLIWLGLAAIRRKAPEPLLLAGGLLPYLVFAEMVRAGFLDIGIFVLTASLFGYLLVRKSDYLVPLAQRPAEPERLKIDATGSNRFVPTAAIISLHASGNYTEIGLEDGRIELDNRNLGALMQALPSRFYRVHRSHAVDLERVERLSAAEGSRYQIHLSDGRVVPVSRREVKALRERLSR